MLTHEQVDEFIAKTLAEISNLDKNNAQYLAMSSKLTELSNGTKLTEVQNGELQSLIDEAKAKAIAEGRQRAQDFEATLTNKSHKSSPKAFRANMLRI